MVSLMLGAFILSSQRRGTAETGSAVIAIVTFAGIIEACSFSGCALYAAYQREWLGGNSTDLTDHNCYTSSSPYLIFRSREFRLMHVHGINGVATSLAEDIIT